MSGTSKLLLEVRGLRVALPGRGVERVAVDNVDFEVARGEVLGLVGESGSGKSLSMLAVMGLLPRGLRAGGSVRFDGEQILGAPSAGCGPCAAAASPWCSRTR